MSNLESRVKEINDLIQNTLIKLIPIWKKTGLKNINLKEEQLKNKIKTFLNEQIHIEENEISKLKKEIDMLINKIISTSKNLCDSEIKGKNYYLDKIIKMSIKDSLDYLNSIKEDFDKKREKQLKNIESYIKKLNELRTQIDLPPKKFKKELLNIEIPLNITKKRVIDLIMDASREIDKRKMTVKFRSLEILDLINTLKLQSSELQEIDRKIIDTTIGLMGIKKSVLTKLSYRKEELINLLEFRENLVNNITDKIKDNYEILSIKNDHFFEDNIGYSNKTIQNLKKELARIEKYKEENLNKLIKKERDVIHKLWDKVNFSEVKRNEFLPMLNNDWTNDNLIKHIIEREKITKIYNKMNPILALIKKRENLLIRRKEIDDTDPNRFRIPGRLIKEEKFRSRWKTFSKLCDKIRKMIKNYEHEFGEFLYNHQNYLDVMNQYDKEQIIIDKEKQKMKINGKENINLRHKRKVNIITRSKKKIKVNNRNRLNKRKPVNNNWNIPIKR